MSGCYDCVCGDVCESSQGICPKYEREPVDLSSLGFEPNYPTKAGKKRQIQDSTQKKESAD